MEQDPEGRECPPLCMSLGAPAVGVVVCWGVVWCARQNRGEFAEGGLLLDVVKDQAARRGKRG